MFVHIHINIIIYTYRTWNSLCATYRLKYHDKYNSPAKKLWSPKRISILQWIAILRGVKKHLILFFRGLQHYIDYFGIYVGLEGLLPKSIISRVIRTFYIIYPWKYIKINGRRKSMKCSRSEAVDKSPRVFFDAEFDFNGPRTPRAIK